MLLIDDVLKVLDRIPIWKRLQEVPSEVDKLKTRVAELEEKLGRKLPTDVCKYCGARALRLNSEMGLIKGGGMRESWKCSACNKFETRIVF